MVFESKVAMAFDQYGQLKPAGPREALELSSSKFSAICPFSANAKDEDRIAREIFGETPDHHPSSGYYSNAYVGHVSDENVRMNGSSGGMVSWVLDQLLGRGLIDGVAHVAAVDDPQKTGAFFRYRISRTHKEIRSGAKSRYYPIEMSQVLDEIRSTPGRYAVVGVPCFIKAVQLLRLQDPLFKERIAYTLALFCGHMKSSRFVESFAWQMGVDVADVKSVDFRFKDPGRPANWYRASLDLNDGTNVQQDWWNLADGDWGAGFFMNSACNVCDDVVGETADISFGDAWVEPYSSDGGGNNVVITRSGIMQKIIADGIAAGELELAPVDGDFVERTQAAGLRQRREGLAYRLTWPSVPRIPKRVPPSAELPPRRRSVYRSRFTISHWSHIVFRAAKLLRMPAIYIKWARAAAAFYHAFAYSRGRLGAFVDRFKTMYEQPDNG